MLKIGHTTAWIFADLSSRLLSVLHAPTFYSAIRTLLDWAVWEMGSHIIVERARPLHTVVGREISRRAQCEAIWLQLGVNSKNYAAVRMGTRRGPTMDGVGGSRALGQGEVPLRCLVAVNCDDEEDCWPQEGSQKRSLVKQHGLTIFHSGANRIERSDSGRRREGLEKPWKRTCDNPKPRYHRVAPKVATYVMLLGLHEYKHM